MTPHENSELTDREMQVETYQELRESWLRGKRLVDARDGLLERLHKMPARSEAEQVAYDNVKDQWLRYINLVKEYQAKFWTDFAAFDAGVGQDMFNLAPLTTGEEDKT